MRPLSLFANCWRPTKLLWDRSSSVKKSKSKSWGKGRGLGGTQDLGERELTERHNRELRRWRTDELIIGLGVLARAYRDRMTAGLRVAAGGSAPAGSGADVVRYERAIGIITEAVTAFEHNPNERLLLESLFVRLGQL